MTEPWEVAGIGKRLAALRKHRGFRNARELAQALPDGAVSESVIQNIEAGRKLDLSISQLLNISRALDVSPLFLLAPLGRPHDQLDLENLSSAFDGMTVSEFDGWVSVNPFGSGYSPTRASERFERSVLDTYREFIGLVHERDRLERSLVLRQNQPEPPDLDDAKRAELKKFDTHEGRLWRAKHRIDELSQMLASAGWDTSWAAD